MVSEILVNISSDGGLAPTHHLHHFDVMSIGNLNFKSKHNDLYRNFAENEFENVVDQKRVHFV